MGGKIIRALEWLLMEFEARMITLLIWLCWICGITSDEVERFRAQHNGDSGAMTKNPRFPPEPRLPSKTAPLPDTEKR